MTVHAFRFTSRQLRGTHDELTEQARIIGAIHFGECVDHFDDFDDIVVDYEVTENEDGSFARVVNATIYYEDEPYDDDDDDNTTDDSDVPSVDDPSFPAISAGLAEVLVWLDLVTT